MLGHIGIVTVLYNSESVLPAFVNSLRNQDYSQWTLYAVDNASCDKSVALSMQCGERVRVIQNQKNLGVAEANNQGIRACIADACDFVLLLNNDIEFPPDLLRTLVDGLDNHRCDMVAPLIYLYEPHDVIWFAGGHFIPWRGYKCVHEGMGLKRPSRGLSAKKITYAPTCCVLMRRDVLDRVGMMDPKYFVYFDDTDWMLRAMRAGVQMYFEPEAVLWHKVSSLTGFESEFAVRYQTRNHAYYNRKHLAPALVPLFDCVHRMYYGLQWLMGWGGRERARWRWNAWHEGRKM